MSDETTETKTLQAWFNGYELIAATSAAEAAEILRHPTSEMPDYEGDEEMIEGEGWKVMDPGEVVLDEDGPTDQTFGDAVREAGKPSWLWSCEP